MSAYVIVYIIDFIRKSSGKKAKNKASRAF